PVRRSMFPSALAAASRRHNVCFHRDYTDYSVIPTKAQSVKHGAPAAGWLEVQSGDLRILQSSALAQLPAVVHAFSTRSGGVSPLDGQNVLNLGFADWDSRENVRENRGRFLRALSADGLSVAALRQFHS